jgi:hypothetical protein
LAEAASRSKPSDIDAEAIEGSLGLWIRAFLEDRRPT